MISVLILLGLATWQTVEVLHHSELFYPARKAAEDAAEGRGFSALLGKLYACPFCLSHWIAGSLTLCWLLGGTWLVYTMAAARLANLCNDVLYDFNKIVRHEPDAETGETEETLG